MHKDEMIAKILKEEKDTTAQRAEELSKLPDDALMDILHKLPKRGEEKKK